MLTLKDDKFVATTLPSRAFGFAMPSLCFAQSVKAIAVLGGIENYPGVLVLKRSVELYHLTTKTWSTLPDMRVGRNMTSSCIHGGYIYIFGGEETRNYYTHKFERLSLTYLQENF